MLRSQSSKQKNLQAQKKSPVGGGGGTLSQTPGSTAATM